MRRGRCFVSFHYFFLLSHVTMSDDQSLHAPQAGLSLAVSSLLVRLARGRHHRTSRANCKSEMEADGSGLLRAVLCLGGWRKVQVFGYPLRQAQEWWNCRYEAGRD
jgi:hypothetical protein